MANKKYSQFTAGTVSNAKILLLADPTTGALEKVTVEQLVGYKVYQALITQTATDPPTAIVLQNTLGEVPTFSYAGVGEWQLVTSATIFTANKTFVTINSFPVVSLLNRAFAASWNSTTIINLNYTRLDTGAGEDASLVNGELEILVFP